MWCSRGCLGPPASTKACWWHVELDGGSRRRGCAAGGVSVKISRRLAGGRLVRLRGRELGPRLRAGADGRGVAALVGLGLLGQAAAGGAPGPPLPPVLARPLPPGGPLVRL